MITVITEEVLEAAREMNRRDVRRAEQIHEGVDEETTSADSPEDEDENENDKIWAKYEGIEGLKGAENQPLKVGGSYYSYGLYSRNRRILADIALAADWGVEKARILEQRCVKRMAEHSSKASRVGNSMDLSNADQPRKNNGRPFTFQHISWTFLRGDIEREVKEMDPTKLAVVKAAVLDVYGTNSKKSGKVLPVYAPGTKRKSDDALPVSEADIQRAQQEIDKEKRYRKAVQTAFLDRESYVPPEKVKLRIKAFLKASGMSREDFCRAIDVTEDEFEAFMSERKKRPQQESKVFHDALSYIRKENGEREPSRKRQKQI
ncbi:hypothetical protein F4820DRAFT_302390 [Hypoxylon rubiginosum]|uniref:Uncharacterized protein n=1 Tax=Hypoxylon rubiginosum TaxID=110542 RepID=A0ACB9Z0Q4_9PEZI|nr:hypothetical protein F4820DRAFT_302390 [Hypoxylon rubiginosum]